MVCRGIGALIFIYLFFVNAVFEWFAGGLKPLFLFINFFVNTVFEWFAGGLKPLFLFFFFYYFFLLMRFLNRLQGDWSPYFYLFIFFIFLLMRFSMVCRGIEALVHDYIRPSVFGNKIPVVCQGLVYGLSVMTLGSLLYFIYADVGLVNAVSMLWNIG